MTGESLFEDYRIKSDNDIGSRPANSGQTVSVSRQINFEPDSVPIYEGLIEKYERRHENLSRLGNIFLASGVHLLGSGLCLIIFTDNADDQFLKLSRTTRSYVSRITAVERTPSIFPVEFLT